MKSLSTKQKELISDSENKKAFTVKYEALQSQNNLPLISDSVMKNIKEVILELDKLKLYKGKGGEIM